MKRETRQCEFLGFQSLSSAVAVRVKERQSSAQTTGCPASLSASLTYLMGQETAGKGPFQHKGPAKGIRGWTGWTQLAIRGVSALCNQVFHSFAFTHMSWHLQHASDVSRGVQSDIQKQLVLPWPATVQWAACLFANAALRCQQWLYILILSWKTDIKVTDSKSQVKRIL